MRKTFEYIYPPPRQKDLKEISSFLNSKCWVFIQILYVGLLNTCHKGNKNNLNCKSNSFENDNICAIQFLVLSSFRYNPQNSYLLLNNFSLKICVKDKVMCKKKIKEIFFIAVRIVARLAQPKFTAFLIANVRMGPDVTLRPENVPVSPDGR